MGMAFISRGVRVVESTESGEPANPIAESRRIDWATLAGVEGGITHRTTRSGSVITAYTGTAATINNALAAASSGEYVELGAGTFNLTTTIELVSNVTLRGQGMSTVLNFTNVGGSGFFFGAGETAIIFQGDFDASGYNAGFGVEGGGFPGGQIRDWDGTGGAADSYPKDGAILNLSSAPSGLSVGDTVLLYQANEAAASLPKNGFWISAKTDHSGSTSTGITWQGSSYGTNHQQQLARVTNISGADVTIWPGVQWPSGTFKAANSPKIAWQTGDIRSAGLEDVYVKTTAYASQQIAAITTFHASNCWIARVAVSPYTGTSGDGDKTQVGIMIRESRNVTVRSFWMDSLAGGGFGSTTSYGVVPVASSFVLVENGIFYHVESPMLMFGPSFGCVYAYNYEIRQSPHEGGSQYHDAGISLTLREGNETFKVMGDLFHDVGMMNTHYREHTFGADAGFDLQSYWRFFNIVGCVIAAPDRYQTLSSDGTLFDRYSGSAFRLGYPCQGASIDPFFNGTGQPFNFGVAHDPQVSATLMRWGNYAVADTTAHFDSGEVPSGLSDFPNSVPGSNDLPASILYPSGAPPYFTVSGYGTVTWPPIGPDVTGGTYEGGRVHKLPAQRVYEDASGVITDFDPSLYGT